MTVYDGSLNSNSLKYISANIPLSLGENSLALTDVSANSRIDVSHFLGRNAKKILVTFNNINSSSSIILSINSCERVEHFNESGSNYLVRNWNQSKGFQMVASRSSSGTWNSYSAYGEIEIDSIELMSTNLSGTLPTVDIIIIC